MEQAYRPRHQQRSSPGPVVALAASGLLAIASARADVPIEVSTCPDGGHSPVTFRIDCSHVRDPAVQQLCRPFIENVACKVSPAYRKITGISLEDRCPVVDFTIYDKDQWPLKGGEAGGFAAHCSAKLITDVSVLRKTALGPFDTHELLHIYQADLGALPSEHILFASTQLEALREMGDRYGYEARFGQTKKEALGPDFEQTFHSARIKPGEQCRFAETNLEARLYISNPKTVYEFWRKVERSNVRDQADREARFNRMFEHVTGAGGARAFLLAHGCSAW